MNFGLQTFTIRKIQKKSIEKAYLPLVEMGIRELEIARIDFSMKNATAVKKMSEKYGIKPVSIQVKPKYIYGDPEKVISFCHATDCKNAVISMLPFECILGSEDKFYRFVDTLDRQTELYAENGITLAYHHHNWEYVSLSNGKTRMNELLSRTEKIRFVSDTYWTARSGISPAKQINEFGDRLLGIHLRDLSHSPKGLSVIPGDTAVGRGVIDFFEVLSAAVNTTCEYAVIEQKTDTPYEDIRYSYKTLQIINSQLKKG